MAHRRLTDAEYAEMAEDYATNPLTADEVVGPPKSTSTILMSPRQSCVPVARPVAARAGPHPDDLRAAARRHQDAPGREGCDRRRQARRDHPAGPRGVP